MTYFTQVFPASLYYFISLMLPVSLFAFRSEKRNRFLLRYISALVVLLFLYCLPSLITYLLKRQSLIDQNFDMALSFILNLLYSLTLCLFAFQENFMTALFCTTGGYCIQHIWGRMIDYPIYVNLSSVLPSNFLYYLLGLVLLGVLCFLFYFFILRKTPHFEDTFVKGRTLQIFISLFLIVFSNFFSAMAFSDIGKITQNSQEEENALRNLKYFISISSAAMALLCLVLLLGMNQFAYIADENAILSQMLHEQQKEFETERTNINIINIKCHDLKHQLAALDGKMSKEEIKDTVKAVNIYDSLFHTGNEALDVVLASKQPLLSKDSIRLTCLLDGSLLNYIQDYEIYSLFGNALDNAIEALRPLPIEKRTIHIRQEEKNDFLLVKIINYFDGTLEKNDQGIQTKKKDKAEHGFGIKSMEMIMKENHGSLAISTDKDVFTLTLVFQLPEKEEAKMEEKK
ncbi:MAG: ATP-binding protein [Eubacteriales bacterium]|nr:ATP-binding protein [Eubacteriales bacterium]